MPGLCHAAKPRIMMTVNPKSYELHFWGEELQGVKQSFA